MFLIICFLIRYTSQKSDTGAIIAYAIVLSWPADDVLFLGAPVMTPVSKVSMLGYSEPFKWSAAGQQGVNIRFPPISVNKLPSTWAWVLKLENLDSTPDFEMSHGRRLTKGQVVVNME